MFGLSFSRFKSMAALQRTAKTMQETGAAAKKELAERVDAKRDRMYTDIDILEFNKLLAGELFSKYEPHANINLKNIYRGSSHRDYIRFLQEREDLGHGMWMVHTRPYGESMLGLKSSYHSYRDDEPTERAVRAGFRGARDLVDVMQAAYVCYVSPHFADVVCNGMALEAIQKSAEMSAHMDNYIKMRGL